MASALSPLAAKDFDVPAAAHLLWRAGFGGTWEEAEKLSAMGLDAAVQKIVHFPEADPPPMPPCAALAEESDRDFQQRMRSLGEEERQRARQERQQEERDKVEALKLWWLGRMLHPEHPFQEKLALFWHGHFASGFPDKIERTFPLWQQNQLFRSRGRSAFLVLLEAVSRDPAMLVWLDNASSTREHPNENYARELMELFTTGVGAYTEKDVRESARAFTGWSVDRDEWSYQFRKDAHDAGVKVFLGQEGPWDGNDIVRILCEQQVTAEFMTSKLLRFFVAEALPDEARRQFAWAYRAGGMDPLAFFDVLFRSKLFYSPEVRGSLVKSPVVLVVGALRSMGVELPNPQVLLGSLRLMGQDLFFPPDVDGWPGGMAFINSNTLLLRYNFANYLVHGVSPDQFKSFANAGVSGSDRRTFIESQRTEEAAPWSPRAQLEKAGLLSRMATARDLVEYFALAFLQRPVGPDLERRLLDFMETDAAGGRRSFSVNDANFDERVKGLIHLVMSSPDYQLC